MARGQEVILIGAGGHAKVVSEIALTSGFKIKGYLDIKPSSWLDVPLLTEDIAKNCFAKGMCWVMGLGGQSIESIKKRQILFEQYLKQGVPRTLIHDRAIVSDSASIGRGTLVGAGAIIQPMAEIGQGVIINTRSVVEHDCVIGEGSHIAPGAIVLGGVEIGKNCVIGAGAVVLPYSVVPEETLVKSNSVFKQS